jgi:iron-sulfur cluster assembly protein
MITINEIALDHIIELMMNENITPDTHHLRVGVKGGGCSGLEYQMKFDDVITESDEVFENDGIKIICDKKSLLYLWGTELNYSGGLNGKGFEWINPNASRVCGCGNSFSA